MRIAKWAIGVALIGSLAAGAARAQNVRGYQTAVEPAYGYAEADSTSAQQSAVTQAAYGYAEAADEVGAPPAPAGRSPSDNWSDYGARNNNYGNNNYGSNSYGSCGSCGGANCGACMECCPLGEPLRIFGKHSSGIEAGGWVSVGGHGNEYRATLNGPLGFNNLGDGINVHQLWFYAGKEAKTDGCGLDWGARVDYVFGVDGPDTQAFRGTQWDEGWTSGDYGSAIPQAYGEIAIDYLTVKAGYFYTPIGYEKVQAPQNFFYSHSYTHYYVEPFTHTGALAAYDGFENFTFYGGWTLGWDTAFEQIGDSNMFLGGITYSPNKDASVTYMTSSGRLDSLVTGRGNSYMHSIVMDLHLTDRLEWVIQSDLHHRDGQRSSVAAGGVNQYLFYKINEYWSLGGRFEWLHDRDGAFVQPGLAAGNYYNLTGGVNWKPHANLTVRPEVRYDWFSGTFRPGGLPFDNQTTDDQFSLGFDVIVLY
jgi:hypothetical protein